MEHMIIETSRLCKKYRGFEAVSDLDIQVKQGSIYALIGLNGAGKTTLLKMLCGLALPTSGEITLFGENSPAGLRRACARTGVMVETPAFLPYLSARDNLEYLRIQRGSGSKASVAAALDFVGLEDAGAKHFGKFSLGMKQRLGLALAVMDGAELLLLDEPINGLDPMGIKEFRDIILHMNKERGTTVLISSHILGELSQIATEYGFLDHGKLLQHIRAAELTERCRSVLYIEVDNAARASALLRSRHENIRLTFEGNLLQISECRDETSVLIQELMENSIAVSQVRQEGIGLEEYFIQLIQGGATNA